ncbi:DUF4259 domain-containing protein [Kitasatospora acidiphila]|uniref:DUF4259 domain-containing protein n=1 Tax=Kitasatospora acidiphila TaxID=2567942 RepID=A0A540WC40_9ACTN|nr:DUF4259 domain-containing protein [Kitasatospora acidiphila]TQF06621.1 DUF4259 domain-containing protein [Kitasatospora acidiphila]
MGTWDVGSFDNDAAADFAGELDEAVEGARAELVRAALRAVLTEDGYLEGDSGERAVAAAALVAAYCPGGEPVNPVYGPRRPVPGLGGELPALAAAALERVVAAGSELAELWDESGEGERWRGRIAALRAVLATDPRSGGA